MKLFYQCNLDLNELLNFDLYQSLLFRFSFRNPPGGSREKLKFPAKSLGEDVALRSAEVYVASRNRAKPSSLVLGAVSEGSIRIEHENPTIFVLTQTGRENVGDEAENLTIPWLPPGGFADNDKASHVVCNLRITQLPQGGFENIAPRRGATNGLIGYPGAVADPANLHRLSEAKDGFLDEQRVFAAR
jgi:hypothetical protein